MPDNTNTAQGYVEYAHRRAKTRSPIFSALERFTFQSVVNWAAMGAVLAAWGKVVGGNPFRASLVGELKNPTSAAISAALAATAGYSEYQQAQRDNAVNEEIADERNAAMSIFRHEGAAMRRRDLSTGGARTHVEQLSDRAASDSVGLE